MHIYYYPDVKGRQPASTEQQPDKGEALRIDAPRTPYTTKKTGPIKDRPLSLIGYANRIDQLLTV